MFPPISLEYSVRLVCFASAAFVLVKPQRPSSILDLSVQRSTLRCGSRVDHLKALFISSDSSSLLALSLLNYRKYGASLTQ